MPSYTLLVGQETQIQPPSAFGLPKPPTKQGLTSNTAKRLPAPKRSNSNTQRSTQSSIPLPPVPNSDRRDRLVRVRQISGLPLYLVRTQEQVISEENDEEDLLLPPKAQDPKAQDPIKQPSKPKTPSEQNNQFFYDDALDLVPQVIKQPTTTDRKTNPDLSNGNSEPLEQQPWSEESEVVEPFLNMDDEDSLLPPQRKASPEKKNEPPPNAEIGSPSDRSLLPSDAEVDAPDAFEFDRIKVSPYKPPSLDSEAEKVVPFPVIPAPDDFPGFGPQDPDLDTLPEPKRRFDLPKPEPVPALPFGSGSPNDITGSQQQLGNECPKPSMPWQTVDLYTEMGAQPLMGPLALRPFRMSALQNRTERLVENRPTVAPIATLPERLQSRHWEFQAARTSPTDSCPLPLMSTDACMVEYQSQDFAPNPQVPQPLNTCKEIETYYGKSLVDTQRPWVEWWRPFYTGGMYEPGIPVFSDVNLLTPSFLVYGDYRTGVGIHRVGGQPIRQWAHRLNLDFDLRLTGTERFHMFTGPLDHNGRFTRLDFSDSRNVEFEEELDFKPDTAFFEGDLGAITGSLIGDDAPFDLPFTVGIIPLLFQNGIWMEDAIVGVAVASPWRHSRALNWSNFESTFFVGFSGIDSPAFQDNRQSSVYGTANFIEAYGGYIELDYAYLDERQNLGRSYHNAAIAFTRRYFGRISNSVRLIGNAGQRGSRVDRTADGGLLLIENSLISSQPSTVVPYFNMFVGSGRPQSVGRAGGSGGILRNTGINFESDGLTAYPTLNATGANAYGGAVGINILSADFRQQLACEFTALDRYGNPLLSGIAGPQYALGGRYQRALNNRSLIRFDLMNGWLDNTQNIYGLRSEFRWKF